MAAQSLSTITRALPAGTPFTARWLAAILPHLPREARTDLLAKGHIGARSLRLALAEVTATTPLPVRPSRRELRAAMLWLSAEAPDVVELVQPEEKAA